MRINNIFASFDGEVNFYGQGKASVFIRTQGCGLKCTYCDTPEAQSFDSGKEMTVAEIVQQVTSYNIRKVTITGGEPFIQKQELLDLLAILLGNYSVTIETSGSEDWDFILEKDFTPSLVVDYKLPGSNMTHKMLPLPKFATLDSFDMIKFVTTGEEDYSAAKRIREKILALSEFKYSVEFAFSAVPYLLQPRILAEWLIRDKIDCYLNVQIHKLLNIL